MKNIKFFEEEDENIDSIEHYLQIINKFRNEYKYGPSYYRGLDDYSYSLTTSAGRPLKHAGEILEKLSVKQEQNFIHRFKRYVYVHTQKVLNDWEALFLARHHGLPVRLLDWTSNPLVALFNAVLCGDKPMENGAIWAIQRKKKITREIDVLTEKRSPFNIPGVKFIHPIYVDSRLIVQSGCFTLHHIPSRGLDEDDPKNYKEDEFDICILRKWRVPRKEKPKLLKHLEGMAINTRTLFPDLDGLAKGIWQLEVVREYK